MYLFIERLSDELVWKACWIPAPGLLRYVTRCPQNETDGRAAGNMRS